MGTHRLCREGKNEHRNPRPCRRGRVCPQRIGRHPDHTAALSARPAPGPCGARPLRGSRNRVVRLELVGGRPLYGDHRRRLCRRQRHDHLAACRGLRVEDPGRLLPYHDEWITWWQRIAVVLDLALLWTLWLRVEPQEQISREQGEALRRGLVEVMQRPGTNWMLL